MDPLIIVLIFVLGLSSILLVGIFCTFFPHAIDRFCVNTSGPRYMMGMNEHSRMLMWRITGLWSLACFVALCSFLVWTAFLRPYYYGF